LPAPPAEIGPFAGFPPDAFRFYAELERDNSRPWFQANRDRYERHVRGPMEALLDLLADGFGDDGKVYRPHRDVRFSADQRPYKEHCGAVISRRYAAAPVRYVQIDADGLAVAVGYPAMSRDQLRRFRGAVDDVASGRALADAVARVRDGGFEVTGSELVRAPRGMASDHPRVELLRHRALMVRRSWARAAWMQRPAAADVVAEAWRSASEVGDWLQAHVGAATDPPRRRGG
jgi:uncharacterized protein (TIGR02453 family)